MSVFETIRRTRFSPYMLLFLLAVVVAVAYVALGASLVWQHQNNGERRRIGLPSRTGKKLVPSSLRFFGGLVPANLQNVGRKSSDETASCDTVGDLIRAGQLMMPATRNPASVVQSFIPRRRSRQRAGCQLRPRSPANPLSSLHRLPRA